MLEIKIKCYLKCLNNELVIYMGNTSAGKVLCEAFKIILMVLQGALGVEILVQELFKKHKCFKERYFCVEYSARTGCLSIIISSENKVSV